MADTQGFVVSVTTTATSIVAGVTSGAYVIQNVGAANVFLGGATVAASGGSKGKRLRPDEAVSFELPTGGDALYGIVAAGTCDVDVLRVDA